MALIMDRSNFGDPPPDACREALVEARKALHALCLERGSTDGYAAIFAQINHALAEVAATSTSRQSPLNRGGDASTLAATSTQQNGGTDA